jgi:hypothetical protein
MTMANPSDEEIMKQYLEDRLRVGELTQMDKMRILEDFRAAQAQRRASTYALYATIAAPVSTLFAAVSVVISIIALMRH